MTITIPLRCANSCMVLDEANSTIVLLDTGNYPSYSSFLNETWTWSGSGAAANWTNTSATLINANGPLPGRINQSMAYDGSHVMLYGGQGSSSTSGVQFDTWTWNGTVWSQVGGVGYSLASPYGRFSAEAAYLEGTGSLLFGGSLANGQLLLETWEWTGTAWNQVTVANGAGPAARVGHAMAGNNTGTVLLFGGSGTNSQFNDTWQYTHAGGWVQQFPATSPSVRSNAVMTYDSTNAQWVLFGGTNEYNYLVETWIFKSGNWTQISVANGAGPAGRKNAQMAYDSTNSQTLLFGGVSGGTNYPSNATWALTGTGTALTWNFLGGN
jgi:hypothetical protein